MVYCIVVACALARCALFHSFRCLKAVQMNVQRSLIRELMRKQSKTYIELKVMIQLILVSRELKKFSSCCHKLDDKTRSVKPKTVEVNKNIEAHPVSSTLRVSGEHGISNSKVIRPLPDHGKSIRICRIV